MDEYLRQRYSSFKLTHLSGLRRGGRRWLRKDGFEVGGRRSARAIASLWSGGRRGEVELRYERQEVDLGWDRVDLNDLNI